MTSEKAKSVAIMAQIGHNWAKKCNVGWNDLPLEVCLHNI